METDRRNRQERRTGKNAKEDAKGDDCTKEQNDSIFILSRPGEGRPERHRTKSKADSHLQPPEGRSIHTGPTSESQQMFSTHFHPDRERRQAERGGSQPHPRASAPSRGQCAEIDLSQSRANRIGPESGTD